jgi:hypothetical protein
MLTCWEATADGVLGAAALNSSILQVIADTAGYRHAMDADRRGPLVRVVGSVEISRPEANAAAVAQPR